MFTKLVKFRDGKYGVRRWTPGGYQWRDLKEANKWRDKGSAYYGNCRGTLEKAIFYYCDGIPVSRKELKQARLLKALGDTRDE